MEPTVKVWDPLVRIFHWGLAGSFAVAWLTADDIRDLHELAGYTAGGLVGVRLIMGFAGSRYARFSQFVRSPGHVLAYAGDTLKHRERRHIGHNPLGGMMVLALMAGMAALAFTGWLQTTDAYWGMEWVEELHELLANLLLGCVILHIGGVIIESLRQHENLVAAMINGRKRAPGPTDVV